MKRMIALVLCALMLLGGSTAAAEWDCSVPTEITEEVQELLDRALSGLLGVSYSPVAVLGRQDDCLCILCKATAVYPGAEPYNALVYIREDGGLQNIYELWVGAHSGLTDYGSSTLYSREEMDEAISLIRQEFDSWEGCVMHGIRYAGDACNSKENIEWMNRLGETEKFTQCIEFTCDFHSPKEAVGAWNPDEEYTDWQWWLARGEGGSWELLTWGY